MMTSIWRGVSSLRPRGDNNERFCANIINAREKDLVAEGCDGRNFLGKKWCVKQKEYEIHKVDQDKKLDKK